MSLLPGSEAIFFSFPKFPFKMLQTYRFSVHNLLASIQKHIQHKTSKQSNKQKLLSIPPFHHVLFLTSACLPLVSPNYICHRAGLVVGPAHPGRWLLRKFCLVAYFLTYHTCCSIVFFFLPGSLATTFCLILPTLISSFPRVFQHKPPCSCPSSWCLLNSASSPF